MRFRHKYISPKANVADTSLVKPDQWNDDHDADTEDDGIVLGRLIGETAGPVQEIPIKASAVSVLLDAFTGLFRPARGTTAQQPAAPDCQPGDLRVNTDTNRLQVWDGFIWTNLAIGETAFVGALEFSIRNTTPTGWIPFHGSIGPVGSIATYHNDTVHALYNLCWDLPPAIFTMLDTLPRGASAAVDWAGLRPILFPDWRGRGFAICEDMVGGVVIPVMSGGAAGGFVATANRYEIGGEKSHVLLDAEMAKHDHTLPEPLDQAIESNLGGTGVGTPVWFDPAETTLLKTGEAGTDAPHNIVQPTVMLNCYVKL